jgi:2-polyprenyl-3-methyl-5-hydroxy-6-metoxy-1,4-benzoquinol methylase
MQNAFDAPIDCHGIGGAGRPPVAKSRSHLPVDHICSSLSPETINMIFDELIQRISRIDIKLADTIRRVERGWGTGEVTDTELTELISSTLLSCIDDGLFTVETMVTGFNAFADELFERQMDCVRSGSYRAKDYETVRKEVYANDAYMASTYYPALLLSYLASPNYRHILRSLHVSLAEWKERGVSRIIDVASGHGLLLLYALKMLNTATGVSVDLSPVAAKFSSLIQKTTGWGGTRFSCCTQDLLIAQPGELQGPFDAAICCELLEHIPNPEAFLMRIRGNLMPQGRLFVSAAVRMESVDHLTFFATTREVTQMIENAGFVILAEMSVPFINSRPANSQKWSRLVEDPTMPVTYIAECQA